MSEPSPAWAAPNEGPSRNEGVAQRAAPKSAPPPGAARQGFTLPPLTKAQAACAWLCGLLLMSMMLLTLLDVVGRYALNAPVPGATELTELLLAVVIFIGLPIASADQDHVRIDLVIGVLPRAVTRALAPLIETASAVILLVIAWQIWRVGSGLAGYGGATMTLHIPLAPVAYLLALLTILAAALHLRAAAHHFKEVLK